MFITEHYNGQHLKQPSFSMTNEQIKKIPYKYNKILLGLRKRKPWIFASTWLKLDILVLNEAVIKEKQILNGLAHS